MAQRLSAFIVAFLFFTGAANAVRVYAPKACMVATSDLIVIGTVDGSGEKQKREILLPGRDKPLERWFHDTDVRVTRVLYDWRGTLADRAADARIHVVAWAKKPARKKPGQIAFVVADGPVYPNLRDGEQYVLVLKKLPKEKGYLLQPDPEKCLKLHSESQSVQKRVEELVTIADVSQWAWGEPVNGVQLALVPDRSAATRRIQTSSGELKGVRLMFCTVLRNVGKEPVAVNHYGHDAFLELWLDGTPLHINKNVKLRKKPFGPEHVSILRPGEMLPLARHGRGPYGDHVKIETDSELLNLKAVYSSTRDKSPANKALWQGRVTSSTKMPTPAR